MNFRSLLRNLLTLSPTPLRPRRLAAASALFISFSLMLALEGCQSETAPQVQEIVYASEANGELRDRLGPESKVIGHARSGERVEILERFNRWARVRLPDSEQAVQSAGGTNPQNILREGWLHQRQFVSQAVFDQFQKLAQDSSSLPSQGQAEVQRLANMRLQPGRSTQVFYQLAADEKVEVLQHGIATRPLTADDLRRGASDPIPEDWLLVRASQNRTGWMLETFLELVPPMDVSRYREGQRIRAWFELYRQQDGDQVRSWYIWASVRRLEGLPHDFEEIRVFVWNRVASRYETSYRERNLKGLYPIHVSMEQRPEGSVPAFRFRHETSPGQLVEKKYYLAGTQVRAVR